MSSRGKGTTLVVLFAAVGALTSLRLYEYLWHAYLHGWPRVFYVPYPDIIGPILHAHIGPQYDAAEVEIGLEFFLALLVLFSVIRWISWKMTRMAETQAK